jgi:hypothetical protein
MCLFLAVMAGEARAQPEPKPLSKDDVLKLLTGSVSARRIGDLARQRGIDFQITQETENELRQAGADDALLSALKQLAPKPQPATLVVNSSVGGARVYVDDVAIGDTSSQGRLRVPNLTAGQHQVRVSLDGYEKFDDAVELAAGETAVLRVTLRRSISSAPTQPTNSHLEAETPTSFERFRVKVYFSVRTIPTGWMTISDKLQFQSDDGKYSLEFAVSEIEDVVKGPWGSERGLLHVQLHGGKRYTITVIGTPSRDTLISAIHSAMVRSRKQ